MPTVPRRALSAFLLACGLAALSAVHGWLVLSAYPALSGDRNLPFLNHDHTYHYYYVWLASQMGRPDAIGYDPFFMAGYGKSLWFPTSSTFPELVGWLTGGSALAYRLYVAVAAWLLPLFLAAAVLVLTESLARGLFGYALTMLWFWTAFPATYVEWGMAAFVLTTGMAVFGASCLIRWMQPPTRRGRWSLWLAGLVCLALGQIGHPSTAITSGSLLLPSYFSTCRRRGAAFHMAFWCVPLLVFFAWSPWIIPTLALWETCRSLATGFVNPNFLGRMLELATGRFPTESALFLAGGIVILTSARRSAATTWWGFAVGALLLFLLGYPLAAVRAFAWLQPGRYTQPLYAVLLVALCILPSRAVFRGLRGAVTAMSLALATALLGLSVWLQYGGLTAPRLSTYLPAPLQELIAELRRFPPGDGRVLFEELERRDALVRLGATDPAFGLNIAALIPVFTRHQLIGGPYLYTHLKTNYTQFGDGKLLDRDVAQLTPRALARCVDNYNVALVVAWSPPVVSILRSNRERYEEVASCGLFRVFRVRRPAGWLLQGAGNVVAQPNRITVRDLSPPEDGIVVLKYHWAPGLRSEGAEVFPVPVDFDPVPFIGVRTQRKEITIHWSCPPLLR